MSVLPHRPVLAVPYDDPSDRTPVLFADTDSPFQVNLIGISQTVPLGQSQQITITMTNTAGIAQTPTFYEALPSPPKGVEAGLIAPAATAERVALPDQDQRVDPQIMADLAASTDGTADFLVFVDQQPDLSLAYTIADWGERGWFVYNTLHENAETSQRDIRQWLEDRGLAYTPLWIVNALVVSGTAADVQDLAARNDVALLQANQVTSLAVTAPVTPSLQQDEPVDERIAWNIDRVQANRVWSDFGVSGQGITVANIDNGVRYDHPALQEQYRGYRGPGLFDHAYNWFDPDGFETDPQDPGDHGTHTMGTMVARGTSDANPPAYGVAPGATWITARGCRSTLCLQSDLIASAQWLLSPTDLNDENPRPDLRPHVINNSWAGDKTSDWYSGYVTAWRAAGIFPVFVTGNTSRIVCGSVASPGDYEHVVGVGATERQDRVTSFTRVGPTPDGRLKPDLMAPGQNIRSTVANANDYGSLQGTSMAAPHVTGAVALLWAANPSLIGNFEATYEILTSTAHPITDEQFDKDFYADCHADTVPNNIYGYGLLDTYAAISATGVDIPWLRFDGLENENAIVVQDTLLPAGASRTIKLTLDATAVAHPGTYRGRILLTNGDLSRSPLELNITLTVPSSSSHATVHGLIVDERDQKPLPGRVTISDGPTLSLEEGMFDVTLPARVEPYDFEVTSQDYVTQTVSRILRSGTQTDVEIVLLENIPRLSGNFDTIEARLAYGEFANRVTMIENTGNQPLTYTTRVQSEYTGVWRSDEVGTVATGWIERPDHATTLMLSDDVTSLPIPIGFPFFFHTQTFTQVFVNPNGVLILEDPLETSFFARGCLPVAETEGTALVPLRIDLDPSQGGAVWYATQDQQFVLTFDAVPLHDQPENTFTFQVVLARDGHVQYNYQHIDQMPITASAGLQLDTDQIQSLGCGDTTPISNELTIELRPQPETSSWLEVPEQTSGTIEPGESAQIFVRLGWVMTGYQQPYRGNIEILSNAPDTPSAYLPIMLSVERLPFSSWMPLVLSKP
ncbi:MAG: S8 family serine peptidase [Chloroflexaceae bacterium]|nr:S8 family serine peptidase [Chloroflexaceae bacterium]